MIKACVFDLDGTTLNTVESLNYPCNETLKHFGLEPVSFEDTKRFVGDGFSVQLQRAMQLRGNYSEEDLKKGIEIYSEIFKADPSRGVFVYDGMKEALQFLKSRGIKLAVLTNKTEKRAKEVIAKFYGEDLFDCICGAGKEFPLKPDPAYMNYLMSRLGANADEVMYFGDSDVDVKTARNAGCILVSCAWGYRSREYLKELNPDYLIDTPYEIVGTVMGRMKTYYLDGSRMTDKNAFYDEVFSEMTGDVDFTPGRNMDAFADIVRGGFGKHGVGEPVAVVWLNFAKAEESLGENFVLTAVKVLTEEGSILTIT